MSVSHAKISDDNKDDRTIQATAEGHESLLTNAFEAQIKLIEQSLSNPGTGDIVGERKRDKNKSKKQDDVTKSEEQTVMRKNQKQTQDKLILSNRSQIYRFDATNIGQSRETDSFPEQTIVHPPTDLLPDSQMGRPNDEASSRAAMLVAWYKAGYHTGYHDAMMQKKLDGV